MSVGYFPSILRSMYAIIDPIVSIAAISDAANIMTSCNVLLAMLSIIFLISGRFDFCAITLFVATLCDYVDGHIARTFLAARTDNREFGKQLMLQKFQLISLDKWRIKFNGYRFNCNE
jgi:CDP-alcohol phosphatidyltransferase